MRTRIKHAGEDLGLGMFEKLKPDQHKRAERSIYAILGTVDSEDLDDLSSEYTLDGIKDRFHHMEPQGVLHWGDQEFYGLAPCTATNLQQLELVPMQL